MPLLDALAAAGGGFQIAPFNAPILPSPRQLGQGLPWSGHLDSEAVTVTPGGRRRPAATGRDSLGTDKAGLWPGGKLDFSLMGLAAQGDLPAQTGALQTTSNDWAANFLRVYQLSYRQNAGPGFVRAGIVDVNDYFATVGLAEHSRWAWRVFARFEKSDATFSMLWLLLRRAYSGHDCRTLRQIKQQPSV
ncbi:hypothetical protein [Thiomonas sp.]